MTEKQVWLITGAGRGLGVDIAQAAVRAGVAKFGRIDVLVNNTGNFRRGTAWMGNKAAIPGNSPARS